MVCPPKCPDNSMRTCVVTELGQVSLPLEAAIFLAIEERVALQTIVRKLIPIKFGMFLIQPIKINTIGIEIVAIIIPLFHTNVRSKKYFCYFNFLLALDKCCNCPF